MQRVLLVLALAFLALPAVATAKGQLTSAEVCGTSGCSTVDQPSQALTGGGDGVPDLAPAPEPDYTVQLTVVSRGRSGFDWPLVCVALAGAFGVALVAALLTRRGRRPATA